MFVSGRCECEVKGEVVFGNEAAVAGKESESILPRALVDIIVRFSSSFGPGVDSGWCLIRRGGTSCSGAVFCDSSFLVLTLVAVKIEVEVKTMAPIVFDKIFLQHQNNTFHKNPAIGRIQSLMILFDKDEDDARNFDLSLQTIM